ncbi:hypothetical protein MferCBS49748_002257 [Microsporum ferrugineum]
MESQVAVSKSIRNNSSYLSFVLAAEPRWIQDTWVSFPANEKLLGVAEYKWSRGESQRALNELCIVRKATKPGSYDWIQTILLESAILFSSGEYGRARSFASEVLYKCESQVESYSVATCRLRDIAHFLHGKIFMAQSEWAEAYSEFSQVVSAPEYNTRADQFMAITYEKSNRHNGEDSQSASTSQDESQLTLWI